MYFFLQLAVAELEQVSNILIFLRIDCLQEDIAQSGKTRSETSDCHNTKAPL